MNNTNAGNLIIGGYTNFGVSMLVILGGLIVIGVGFLVFKVGWGIMTDRSYNLFGYYVNDLPYPGYKRFKSKKWNLEHME